MALVQATYVENGKAVGGVIPDASSAIGYKENVGGTCANPNGYTAGSSFMASNNGYMYKALTNIAYGDAFNIGTNCEQTNVSAELDRINEDLSELKEKVGEGMVLDFDNTVELAPATAGVLNTTIPGTKNGVLYVCTKSQSSTPSVILINGKEGAFAVGTNDTRSPMYVYGVKGGDVVTSSASITANSVGYRVNFIPYAD